MKLIVFLSLALCLSAVAQPNPINRRAMAIAGLAKATTCTYVAPPPASVSNCLMFVDVSTSCITNTSGITPAGNGDSVLGILDGSTNHAQLQQSFPVTTGFGGPGVYFTSGGGVALDKPRIIFPACSTCGNGMFRFQAHSEAPTNQPITTFTLVRPFNVGGGVNPLFTLGDGSGGSASARAFINGSLVQIGAGSFATGPSTIVNSNLYLFTIVFNGGSSSVRTNGVPHVSGINPGSNGGKKWDGPGTSIVGVFAMDNIEVGGYVFGGEFYTFACYNWDMTGTSSLTNVENWIMDQYGISHP